MYNEDIKLEFIDYNDKNNLTMENGFLPRLFNQVSYYEEKLNKDCCNFTITEIIAYYKSLYSISLEYLMNVNSQFRKYADWYQKEKTDLIDNQNHYQEIDKDLLMTCVNTKLNKMRMVTRKDLLKKISLLRNPSDKFIILGLFEGIGGDNFKEFFDITENSFGKNSITLNTGRTIPISQKLIDIGKESIEEYTYEIATKHSEAGYQVRNFNENDKTVIKIPVRKTFVGDDNDPQLQHQRIYSRVIRMKKLYGEEVFTPSTLIQSGLIEKVREVMKNKNLSINKALKDKEVTDIFNKTISASRFVLKYGDYIKSLEEEL